MTLTKVIITVLATACVPIVTADASSYQQNARAATDQLMSLYDQSTGIWHDGASPLWWNSANMLTALTDLSRIDSYVKDKYAYVIGNTFANAPAANPNARQIRLFNGMYTKVYTQQPHHDIVKQISRRGGNGQGFLNGFYDDEGWWALAWIDAYDLTGNSDYLETAKQIWSDIKGGQTTPCGGIWWDKKNSYIASIANELYLATSAALSIRVGSSEKQQYIDAAKSSLDFFKSRKLISSDNLVVDGLDSNCNPTGAKFTYNQGVILGGLLDLSKATGDSSYSALAAQIANAAIAASGPLVTNSILHEPNNCEQTDGCGNDGDQFKGVFVRNLRRLQQEMPNESWKSFLSTNAQSIWNNDRSDTATTLGPNWAGPYIGNGKAPAQCSALECLIAAEATQ